MYQIWLKRLTKNFQNYDTLYLENENLKRYSLIELALILAKEYPPKSFTRA